MKTLKDLFPRGSQSFLDANPQPDAKSGGPSVSMSGEPYFSERRRGVMNKTETEFSFILEAQMRKGEILSWEFEGITLRFNGVKYSPDFVVFCRAYIKLIEIKGPYIKGKFERAVERFRHAKTYYGDRFLFELWQRTRAEGWKRLL